MINLIAALQPLVVGAVLIWSARVKLVSPHAAQAANRSALAGLVGQRRALPAYRLLGGVEVTIGALLLLPPVLRAEALAATALAVAFLGYLGYARRAAPTSSCGCLSARATPVSGRSLARPGSWRRRAGWPCSPPVAGCPPCSGTRSPAGPCCSPNWPWWWHSPRSSTTPGCCHCAGCEPG
ncbi:hypothetical protein GCM10027614_71980 [Micromonospora vulcania]